MRWDDQPEDPRAQKIIAQMEIDARADRDEIRRLKAEVVRLEKLILTVDNEYQQRWFPLLILSEEARRIRAAPEVK